MISERVPRTGLYGPMPEVGTVKICDFCRLPVALRRNRESGWHYWVRDEDPVDGGRYCDGGTGPGTARMPPVWTLHVPKPTLDLRENPTERWFHRYTPDGTGRFA
jgi:hypothetical protein